LNDGIGRPTKAPRNYQFYFEVRRGVRPGPSGQSKIISSLEDYPGRQGLPSTHLACNNKQRGYRSCLTRHLYLSAFFGRLKAGAGFPERARPRSMLHDISKVNSAHTIAIVPSLQHEEVVGIHIQASV